MTTLLMLIGLPASGKSTLLEDCYSDLIVVNPDSIRMAIFKDEFNADFEGMVWFAARTMVKMLLLQGHDVALDATNITLRRKEWIELAHNCHADATAVVLQTTFEECMKRNKMRNRVVPDDVMERMCADYVKPTVGEGFDLINYVEVI